MKRRDALRGIILFSLGTGIIYSCTDKYKAIRDLGLNYFAPKDNELDLISMLSEAIVPLKSIPSLANHTPLPFIFTMLDDVYRAKERDLFSEVYQNFDELVETSESKKFSAMNEEERIGFLGKLNDPVGVGNGKLNGFFNMIKRESLRYLKTSEYYQRKVNYYEMAPGRFKGDVLLSELKNANQI